MVRAPISELIVLHILFDGWIGDGSREIVMAVIAVMRGFYFPVHWLDTHGPWLISAPLQWYYRLWLGQFEF